MPFAPRSNKRPVHSSSALIRSHAGRSAVWGARGQRFYPRSIRSVAGRLETNFMTLSQRADRIRSLVNVARGCIIEISRELIEAKQDIPHGYWLPWLEREFGWTEDTAQRYMRVANAFQIPQRAVFEDLAIDATALYALAAPDVSQAARDAAIEQAEAGEHITNGAVRQ